MIQSHKSIKPALLIIMTAMLTAFFVVILQKITTPKNADDMPMIDSNNITAYFYDEKNSQSSSNEPTYSLLSENEVSELQDRGYVQINEEVFGTNKSSLSVSSLFIDLSKIMRKSNDNLITQTTENAQLNVYIESPTHLSTLFTFCGEGSLAYTQEFCTVRLFADQSADTAQAQVKLVRSSNREKDFIFSSSDFLKSGIYHASFPVALENL